jgi:ABC-type multidrug transport system fused ATPase/permease subunit
MIPSEENRDFFIHRDSWPEEGRIVFDNVNLKYRPNTEIILKNLSFEIRPREKIGVVGRTGAGKSTICLSLSRIVEIASG